MTSRPWTGEFTCYRGIFRKCACCGKEFEIHSANHVRCLHCRAEGRKIPQ